MHEQISKKELNSLREVCLCLEKDDDIIRLCEQGDQLKVYLDDAGFSLSDCRLIKGADINISYEEN